jgi:hypothetical protein
VGSTILREVQHGDMTGNDRRRGAE